MIQLIYTEGWLIVFLALGAALACFRNGRKILNAKRGVRMSMAVVGVCLALITAASLLGWLPGLLGLMLLLGSLAGLLLTIVGREIIEAPGRRHD